MIALGRVTGLVPGELAQVATAVVGISMMLTPFLAIGARVLAGRIQRDRASRPDADRRQRRA